MKRQFEPLTHAGQCIAILDAASHKPIIHLSAANGADPKLVERALRLIEIMFNYESFPGQNELLDVVLDEPNVMLTFGSDEAAERFHDHVAPDTEA